MSILQPESESDPRCDHRRGFAWGLAKQSAGAVAWGLFLAAAPFELVVGGCIVWVPLLVWRERVRSREYGFLPGGIARLAITAFIIIAAANAPKHLDRVVGPLRFESISLSELCQQLRREHEIPVAAVDDGAFEKIFLFATTARMSRREVVAELAKTTNREQHFAGCANGSSFLSGVGGTYYLSPKRSDPLATSE
jgi:hypothetical protein